jgi:hypothetical protein
MSRRVGPGGFLETGRDALLRTGDGRWPRCGPEDRNVIAVRSGGAQCYRRATIVGVTGRGSIELPVSQVSADAAAARPSAIAHTISD